MPEDTVIIGAGPAGVSAATQCRRFGLNPVLIDEQGEPGGLIKNAFCVENYPGLPPTDGPSFARLLKAHLERFELKVTKRRAIDIAEAEGGYSVQTDLGAIVTRTVIIATGTQPKPLDIPGVAENLNRRFFYEVRPADHLKRLRKVAIIGGGEAALDYALTLSRRRIRVLVLVRRDRVYAVDRLIELVSKTKHIDIVFDIEPLRFIGSPSRISIEAETPSGKRELEVDAVFAAIGRQSTATELLKGLDADPAGALTTLPTGLFMIGDAKRGSLGQVGIAVGEGLVAAGAVAKNVLTSR